MKRPTLVVLILALLIAVAFFLHRDPRQLRPTPRPPAPVVATESAVASPSLSPAPPSATATAVAPTPAPEPRAVPGTIRGTVRLNGPIPKRKTFKMDAEPPCLQYHSGRVLSEEFVVDGYGNVQWAFVYVKSGLTGGVPPVPAEPVYMDQVACVFTPHVVGVRAGQPLVILNSDNFLHNAHAIAVVNKEFNFGLPKAGMQERKAFDKPEIMIPIKCDVHPWMKAFIGVLDHPYFSVTNAVGSYAIEVPPGNYRVETWHEKCKPVSAWIAVAPGQTSTYDFVLDVKTE